MAHSSLCLWRDLADRGWAEGGSAPRSSYSFPETTGQVLLVLMADARGHKYKQVGSSRPRLAGSWHTIESASFGRPKQVTCLNPKKQEVHPARGAGLQVTRQRLQIIRLKNRWQ